MGERIKSIKKCIKRHVIQERTSDLENYFSNFYIESPEDLSYEVDRSLKLLNLAVGSVLSKNESEAEKFLKGYKNYSKVNSNCLNFVNTEVDTIYYNIKLRFNELRKRGYFFLEGRSIESRAYE